MRRNISSAAGNVLDVDANGSAKIVARPWRYDSLGYYRLSMASGVMAAGLAATSEIFQFRWTHATNLAAVRRIRFGAGGIVGFAAGIVNFEALIARSFSAAGSGGTAATITGDNAKLRTSMGTTGLGEARCASTAALGAGTKTLAAHGFGNAVGSVPTTAGAAVMAPTDLFHVDGEASHPLVLAQNEGFVIRATVPATGTWTFGVTVEWAELATF